MDTFNNDLKSSFNKNLCGFIKKKFFCPFKINGQIVSMNKYAKACELSSSTISKINEESGYNIPILTIYQICTFEKISLEIFFKEFSKNLKL